MQHRGSYEEWLGERRREERRARRRRNARGVLVAFVALALTGLGLAFGPAVVDALRAPEAGYVTRKDFRPAHVQIVMTCARYTKNGACAGWTTVPVYHTDSWRLKLREPDGEKSGWRTVSEAQYERYNLGEWYP